MLNRKGGVVRGGPTTSMAENEDDLVSFHHTKTGSVVVNDIDDDTKTNAKTGVVSQTIRRLILLRRRLQHPTNHFQFLVLFVASGFLVLMYWLITSRNYKTLQRLQHQESRLIQQVRKAPHSSKVKMKQSTPEMKQQNQQQNEDETTKLPTHHLVFSSSCSVKQDWQSYLFFHQAMTHQQPGTVTRIASGCSPDEQEQLQSIFDDKIAPMSTNTTSFHIHFTPEFGRAEGFSYQKTKYWNKPFGLNHWMEHVFNFQSTVLDQDRDNIQFEFPPLGSNPHDEDIIILVDPDMFITKPILNDFSGHPTSLWVPYHRSHAELLQSKSTSGHAVAQHYGFYGKWLDKVRHNLTYILGTTSSPVYDVTKNEARGLYPAGPPYIVTAYDMYRISVVWKNVLPRYFQVNPVMMAEMYSYSMAAAHLSIPHQLGRFMVSNVEVTSTEGWDFLNEVPVEEVCSRTKDPTIKFQDEPYVIHYCQRYSIGDYFYSKYRTHHGLLSCDEPLYELPPTDAAAQYMYERYGDGSKHELSASASRNQRLYHYRRAYMVCTILPALNDAATYYKQHHCANESANYETSFNFLREEKIIE